MIAFFFFFEQQEMFVLCVLLLWVRASPSAQLARLRLLGERLGLSPRLSPSFAPRVAQSAPSMSSLPISLVGAIVGTKADVPSAVPSATLRAHVTVKFLLNGLRSLALRTTLRTALSSTEVGTGSGSGSGSSSSGGGSGSGGSSSGSGSGGVDSVHAGVDSVNADAGAGLKNVFLAFADLAGALPASDADVHLVLTWLTDTHVPTTTLLRVPLLRLVETWLTSAHDDAALGSGAGGAELGTFRGGEGSDLAVGSSNTVARHMSTPSRPSASTPASTPVRPSGHDDLSSRGGGSAVPSTGGGSAVPSTTKGRAERASREEKRRTERPGETRAPPMAQRVLAALALRGGVHLLLAQLQPEVLGTARDVPPPPPLTADVLEAALEALVAYFRVEPLGTALELS